MPVLRAGKSSDSAWHAMNDDFNVWADDVPETRQGPDIWQKQKTLESVLSEKNLTRASQPSVEVQHDAIQTLDQESIATDAEAGGYLGEKAHDTDDVPTLQPLLDAVFAADLFSSSIKDEVTDTNGICVAPLSIDSTAATYRRLVTLKHRGGPIRFSGSAIEDHLQRIVAAWHAQARQQKPSWDRPMKRISRMNARESIGTTLFGWTSHASAPSSRPSSRSGATSRGINSAASTPLTSGFAHAEMAGETIDKRKSAQSSLVHEDVPATAPIESETRQASLPSGDINVTARAIGQSEAANLPRPQPFNQNEISPASADTWDLSFFEKLSPVASAVSPISPPVSSSPARQRATSRSVADEATAAEIARIVALLPDISFLVQP